MPFSFSSKIIAEYHIDDCTTATGSGVTGVQWPARVGTGNITGPVLQAARFGSKRGARITSAATRASFGVTAGVKAFAFVARDIGDGNGRNTVGNDTITRNNDFVAYSEVRIGNTARRWFNGRSTTVVGYKDGRRASPASFTRHTTPSLHYAEIVAASGITVDAFGSWFGSTNSDLGAILLLNAPLTQAENEELAAAYRADFGLPTNLPPLFIARGDSMTEGMTANALFANADYPAQLSNNVLSEKWDYVNAGISGNSVAGILSGYGGYNGMSTNEAVWLPAEAANRPQKVFCFWIGTNDFGAYSQGTLANAGATAYANLVTACNNARAYGATKIIVMTLIDRTDNFTTSGNSTYSNGNNRTTFNANRAQYNNLILANYSASSTGPGGQVADVVIDLTTSPELQTPSNGTFFADGLHLTAAGYGVVADRIAATGFYNAAAFTLTGPISGAKAVASSNFTVIPNGDYTGTITPSDGGQGGTFSPTSLTWAAELTPKTFAYTPASVGAKSISATGTGGIAAPSAVTYTSLDVTSPVLASATINAAGSLLTLSFTEVDSLPLLPATGITGFTISGGHTLSAGTRATSTTITYTISPVVMATETITVSYAGGNVTDSATPTPNALAAIVSGSVTNNSTQVPQAVSFTLTGPTSGNVGAESTAFTATPVGGVYTGTITPSDGGQGGTFIPTSLTWAAENGAKTFAYTPATIGAKSITGTANPLLTAPSALTYTSLALPVVANPVFAGVTTFYNSAQVVITTPTLGATIRYTVDGSIPTETSGTVYSGPITITDTTTIKAISCKAGSTTSGIVSKSVTKLEIVPGGITPEDIEAIAARMASVLTDQGYTPARAEKIDALSEKTDLILGLVGSNVLVDEMQYDGQGNLAFARIRVYDGAANAQSGGNTGLLATFRSASTYAGGKLATERTMREL